MGLKIKLDKKNNPLYVDFDAYWSIENVRIVLEEGLIAFEFNAYPSREAKKCNNTEVIPSLPFGGPTYPVVSCILYGWNQRYRISELFSDGIPASYSRVKERLYQRLKQNLLDFGIKEWEDILE